MTRRAVQKAVLNAVSDPRRVPTQLQLGLANWLKSGGKIKD